MALIQCPECQLQVSDKALSCPHCGYPMTKTSTNRQNKPSKRKRLPNGFGRITEIKNQNLRNRFRAIVTVGKDEFNKPIGKLLKPQAYFSTYNEAYAALMEYNKNPYDLEDDITFEELYEKWSEKYFTHIAESSTRTITSAWEYVSAEIRKMRAKDVRARHLKGVMEDGYRIETRGKNKGQKVLPTASTKSRIKSMFNLMFDYALEHEIVERNYARTFDVSDEIIKEIDSVKRNHFPFNDSEQKILWENVDRVKYVDWILIQCYMGWRPQELATLRLDDVNLTERYIRGGMKTEAGIQRIVPIHSRIFYLVQKNYNLAVELGSEYLFNSKGQTHAGSYTLTYDKYRHRFDSVISTLGLNPLHRPHDPRATFATNAKRAGVDEFALKRMIGHKIQDITEAVYTQRDLEWLRSDIEKIE